jgi:hypothetical protein
VLKKPPAGTAWETISPEKGAAGMFGELHGLFSSALSCLTPSFLPFLVLAVALRLAWDWRHRERA